MNNQEKRIIAALLLLLGFSALAVGIYTDQLSKIVELLQSSFNPL